MGQCGLVGEVGFVQGGGLSCGGVVGGVVPAVGFRPRAWMSALVVSLSRCRWWVGRDHP